MKAIELFAGIGGFRLGLERNNIKVIWANEWDKYAADTYDKNFKDNIDRRDITAVPATDIPSHDLICGGFPCQAFSVAGKRRGFQETRGTLFFEILRIARHHRTPYLLLENVKGLLSHDSGRTFETILGALDESGYDCQWQVLNSKDFGVPQSRERIYIIGHFREEPRPQVFPLAGSKGHVGEGDKQRTDVTADTITTRYGSRNGRGTHIKQVGQIYDNPHNSQAGRVYDVDGLAPTLDVAEGGNRQPKVIVGSPKYGNGKRRMEYKVTDTFPTIRATQHKSGDNQPKILQDIRGVKKSQNGKGFKEDAELSYTVDTFATQGIATGTEIRRLTPVECERLQGFPDNWTAGVSDSQRYKQCGNGCLQRPRAGGP